MGNYIKQIVNLRDKIELLEDDKSNCISEIKQLRAENKRLLDIGCDFQHKVELLTNELTFEKNLRLMFESCTPKIENVVHYTDADVFECGECGFNLTDTSDYKYCPICGCELGDIVDELRNAEREVKEQLETN